MKFLIIFLSSISLLGLSLTSLASPNEDPQELPQLSTQEDLQVHPKISFNFKAEDIKGLCKTALDNVQSQIDSLIKSKNDSRTFANTVAHFDWLLFSFNEQINPIVFLKETSPSLEIHEAAEKCADEVSAFYAKLFTRVDLYNAMNVVAEQKQKLDLEDAKLLEETLRGFRRSGAALVEDKRIQVAKLKEELSQLENKFASHLSKANDTIELTTQDLDGMTQDFISKLKKTDKNTYLLTLLDSSSYLPFLENGKSDDARKRVVTAHDKVAADTNVQLLEKAIALRDQIAKLMGFKNHAEYVLDAKMAKSPARAIEFLEDLSSKLKLKLESDLAKLLELKKKDKPAATAIELWDWRYYANQLKKTTYSVDNELIREYFPVDHVIKTVLELYQKILSVEFTELQPKPEHIWSPDVRLYQIKDKATSKLIAHFYLDLYPRPNKYKHFAAFDISGARINLDGTYHTPVSAVVGNFPKAVEGKPALLQHNDVDTFFHEFGHIMHQTLTTARYAALSGTSVRRDFVEAPSQMLENWAWDKSMLSKISKHYKTGKPLPKTLIKKMVDAKHAYDGIYYSRQLFFATVDMRYHTLGEKLDTTKIWNNLMPEIFSMREPEGTQAQATFGHLMGGYDAGYYGYLWSKVYAEDMFTVFEKEGLESPKAGARYRKWILQPGGTREPDVLIRNFLGREPNKEAFYKSLGL